MENDAWQRGLDSVSHVERTSRLFKSYPDPTTIALAPGSDLAMANWLWIRAAVLVDRLSKGRMVKLSNHEWCMFCRRPLDYTAPASSPVVLPSTPVDSSPSNKKCKISKSRQLQGDESAQYARAMALLEKALEVELTSNSAPATVSLQGCDIRLREMAAVPKVVKRFILWEMYELHFRSEFETLLRDVVKTNDAKAQQLLQAFDTFSNRVWIAADDMREQRIE